MKVTSKWPGVILLALSVLGSNTAYAQTRPKADVRCQPTATPLQYDCEIKLADARSGQPLSGVDLSVGADMPSMPGMHHVAPVKAAEAPGGTYRARLELEMHGDWALQMNISGRMRDRVVKVFRFEPDHVGEAGRR